MPPFRRHGEAPPKAGRQGGVEASEKDDDESSFRLNSTLVRWRSSGKVDAILDRPITQRAIDESFARIQSENPTRGPPEVIVLTSGAAGLGKSTMVQRLETRVCQTQGYFVHIDCERGCDPDPHAPLVHALRVWAEILRNQLAEGDAGISQRLTDKLSRDEKRFLCSIVKEYQSLLGLDESDDTDDGFTSKERTTFFKVVSAKLIYTLASLGPCVVALVDIHRTNETVADFMSSLLHAEDLRDEEWSYVFLATYRPDAIQVLYKCVEVMRTQLVRRGTKMVEMMLEPFTKQEVHGRLAEVLVVENHDLANQVAEISHGNPFFIARILETLVTAEALVEMNNTWILGGRTTGSYHIPAQGDLLSTQQLCEESFQFLQIMSCLGAGVAILARTVTVV